MAIKPTVFPQFAKLDLNNGTGGAPNVVEPSSGKKDSGWNEGERPPRETFNWLHRITNDWIEYFDGVTLSAPQILDNFEERPLLHSGLSFFVGDADLFFGGERFTEIQTATTLADDTTNFVFYDHDQLDVDSQLGSFPGGSRTIPLFIVVTVAGAITTVTDVRSWATMPDLDTSILSDHQLATAGRSMARVELLATDTTPTPDVAVSNFFEYKPTGAVSSFTFQDPASAESLNASTQSQEIWIWITLNDATQTGTFSGAYEFTDDPTGGGAIDGAEGLEYLIHGVYDASGTGTWLCKIVGGRRTHQEEGSFTATLTGFTSNPSGTMNFIRTGKLVTLFVPAAISSTSNSTAMTLTGIPAALIPTTTGLTRIITPVIDNANAGPAMALVFNDGSISFSYPDADWQTGGTFTSVGFTASGNKGLNVGWTITYILD